MHIHYLARCSCAVHDKKVSKPGYFTRQMSYHRLCECSWKVLRDSNSVAVMGIVLFRSSRQYFVEYWTPNSSVLVISPNSTPKTISSTGLGGHGHASAAARRISSCSRSEEDGEQSRFVQPYLPNFEESGLGRVEYDNVAGTVSELADPSPAAKKTRKTRGKYAVYSPEKSAEIGEYALENGNERARLRFLAEFPNLHESTIRNFKAAYKQCLKAQKKQAQPLPITALPCKPRGRPPILLELDEKLIKFLRAVRSKGGVVNIHVVHAATTALIASNPSTSQQLLNFGGMTSRPPVQQGLYDECRVSYLRDIDTKRKKYNIPPELIINADQTPSSYICVSRQSNNGSAWIKFCGSQGSN